MYDIQQPDMTDQNLGRTAAASLSCGSEWSQWTEAASDRRLGWIGTKRHRHMSDANVAVRVSVSKENIFSI